MKKILSLLLSLALGPLGFIALAAAPARAQAQVNAATKSLDELRRDYQKLLAVDRDANTTQQVREFNRAPLEAGRARLRAALQTNIADLRKYQSSMAGTLSEQDNERLGRVISELEMELASLDAGAAPRATAPRQRARGSKAAAPSRRAAPANGASAAADETAAKANGAATTRPAGFTPDPTPRAAAEAANAEPAAAQDTPNIKAALGGEATVAEPKATVKVTLNDPSNALGNKLKVTVASGENKKVTEEKVERLDDAGRLIAAPSKDVEVELFEGDNTVTVSGKKADDTEVASNSVAVNFTPPAEAEAEAEAPPAKPGLPVIEFVEAGARAVRVFALTDADVNLYVNAQKVGSAKAVVDPASGSTSPVAIFRLAAPADLEDIVEAEQTVAEQTSNRAQFVVTEGAFDDTQGGPVGLLLGGAVMSQQAQKFEQSDPFMGFIAGYTSSIRNAYMDERSCGFFKIRRMKDGSYADERGFVVVPNEAGSLCDTALAMPNYLKRVTDGSLVRNTSQPKLNESKSAWRWNVRFQGIFQASPRTAEADPDEDGDGDAPGDPFKFIASRKTFDIEGITWIDFWANNAFSIGPYFAAGASAAISKNELQGEAVTDGESGEGGTDTVSTNARSDNDMKKFLEFGALMNVNLFNRRLFVQSILGVGHYEALDGLYADYNTKRRFLGKLRVFPAGLNRAFGRQIQAAPMFGVDINASRGPDHVRFFTGFAVRIRDINPN